MNTPTMLRKYFFSILAVYGITLFFLSYSAVSAATLRLSPDTGVYTAGGTFSVRIVVNTQGQPINAAEGEVAFDPSDLSVDTRA